MSTKRTPLPRPQQLTEITPAAIEIYAQMRKLRCSCGPYPNPREWWGRKQCRACTAWWNLHSRLADEIAHRPWEWPLICPPTKYPVYDHEAKMFTRELAPRLSDQRMDLMEKALREAAKEQRAWARVGETTVDVEIIGEPASDGAPPGDAPPTSPAR